MREPEPAAHPSLPPRPSRTVRGFLLWSPERGSWQYDVLVVLIVLFVLLTPARYFHDQPVYSPALTRDVVRLGGDTEGVRYRVSALLLANYHEDPRRAAEEVLAEDLSHPVTITRILPIAAQDGTVVWYDVWLRE